MSAFDYAELFRHRGHKKLFRHRGHKIVCVSYGQYNDPENVAIECETCSEVILDFDRPCRKCKLLSSAMDEPTVCPECEDENKPPKPPRTDTRFREKKK